MYFVLFFAFQCSREWIKKKYFIFITSSIYAYCTAFIFLSLFIIIKFCTMLKKTKKEKLIEAPDKTPCDVYMRRDVQEEESQSVNPVAVLMMMSWYLLNITAYCTHLTHLTLNLHSEGYLRLFHDFNCKRWRVAREINFSIEIYCSIII